MLYANHSVILHGLHCAQKVLYIIGQLIWTLAENMLLNSRLPDLPNPDITGYPVHFYYSWSLSVEIKILKKAGSFNRSLSRVDRVDASARVDPVEV